MLTPDQELALVRTMRAGRARQVAKTTVYRGRRDPAHPAYREHPGGPTRDERCDTVVSIGKNGHQVLVTRAPEDAVRAFWAAQRTGPKTRRTGPQEQQ